jgi:hypothetical protein
VAPPSFVLYLVAGAALIVALSIGSNWVQRWWKERKPEEYHYRQPDHADRPSYTEETDAHAMAGRLHAIASQLHAQKEEYRRLDRKRELREVVTIVVIALTAAFAFGSDWIFYRQLVEMQAERRPWIKVEPSKIGGLEAFALQDTDKIPPWALSGVMRGRLNVAFKLTNVGHAPAFNVRFQYWALLPVRTPTGIYMIDWQKDLFVKQHIMCEQFSRERSDELTLRAGITVFPDDGVLSTDIGVGGAMFSQQDINLSIREDRGTLLTQKGFMIFLYGCADYTLEDGAAEHHQTGFGYVVRHRSHFPNGEEVWETFFKPDEGVSGDDIKLYPVPSFSGLTN